MKLYESFSVSKLNCFVDLHIHLDGAISLVSAKKLAAMQGISIPQNDEKLRSVMQVSEDCSNLNEFLEKFAFPCSLLQNSDAISFAVYNLLSELKNQGVMYAEIRFAPQKSTDGGLTQTQVVSAALDGIKKAPIPAKLILCCMRGDDNHKENIETVSVAQKFLNEGVAAIDLAGAEALYKTENFRDIFELAKNKGVPFTIHAGEADGPKSVETAISFGASRIGHGVRALEDKNLIKKLAADKIPLELCPTSNVCTAIYGSIKEWPLKDLINNNIFITLNTDDPEIEGITIKSEYQKLIDEFELDKSTVKQFLLNGVTASFAEPELKKKMSAKIESEFN